MDVSGLDPELLTRARRKKRLGEELTSVEVKALQTYHNKRNRRALKVYFADKEEEEEFRRLAKEDGYTSLSRWFVEKARLASTGVVYEKSFVEGMREKIAALESSLREEVALRRREGDRADMEHQRAREYEQKFLDIASEAYEQIEYVKAEIKRSQMRRPPGKGMSTKKGEGQIQDAGGA